jgi:hypothetical protein
MVKLDEVSRWRTVAFALLARSCVSLPDSQSACPGGKTLRELIRHHSTIWNVENLPEQNHDYRKCDTTQKVSQDPYDQTPRPIRSPQ